MCFARREPDLGQIRQSSKQSARPCQTWARSDPHHLPDVGQTWPGSGPYPRHIMPDVDLMVLPYVSRTWARPGPVQAIAHTTSQTLPDVGQIWHTSVARCGPDLGRIWPAWCQMLVREFLPDLGQIWARCGSCVECLWKKKYQKSDMFLQIWPASGPYLATYA